MVNPSIMDGGPALVGPWKIPIHAMSMINLNRLEWVFTVKRPAFLKGGFRFTPIFFEYCSYCSCSGVLCFFKRKPYSCSFRFGIHTNLGMNNNCEKPALSAHLFCRRFTCDPNEVLSLENPTTSKQEGELWDLTLLDFDWFPHDPCLESVVPCS